MAVGRRVPRAKEFFSGNPKTNTTERTENQMNIKPIAVLSRFFLTALVAAIPAAFAGTSAGDLPQEPDKTLAAAHASFLKGDREKAAADIHKAADYVRQEADKVGADSKAALKKSGEDLDKFGDGVKNGTVKSADELKRGFAATDHALATAWHQTAEATKKSGEDAGEHLRKAGASLDAAAKWSGHELDTGAKESVAAMKKAGKATGAGVKAGAQDVDKWFKGVGEGIKHLGGKL
jgi:hypothetical protein